MPHPLPHLLLSSLLLTASLQPTPPSEPGVAESRETPASLPTTLPTFTHPTIEARGVWIVPRDMALPPDQLLPLLDQLQSAHINTLLIDTYFRGVVAYPDSKLLPQFADFAGKDPIQFLITESLKRNITPHLWMEYGFYAYFTPDPVKDTSKGRWLDANPHLLAIDAKGNSAITRSFGTFYSLCPSNPESHRLLASLYVEAAQRYPLAAGVNLDRIRYPESDFCFCNYCKTTFKSDTGLELQNFPPNTKEAQLWLDWKRARTLAAVRTISSALRTARPDLLLTSYVVGPSEMDSKAQSWDLWMKENLLDAVAVSMYAPDISSASTRAKSLLGNSTTKLLYALNSEHSNLVLQNNIQRSRTDQSPGQYLWHFGTLTDDLQSLSTHAYAHPAKPK